MVGWTIVMLGIILIGVVVAFNWKQRQAGHIAFWLQQRAIEERKGEVAWRLPDSLEGCQKLDHATASVERIDGEISHLTGARGPVVHHVS